MIDFKQTIPVVRIFDLQKAKDFYVEFLGFNVDWEHRFEESFPVYIQISRAGLTIHLSEHHRDACPGSTVFVWMVDIDEFHAEISRKNYRYGRPRLETTFYDAKCFEVIDPFGNRIKFNEAINR